MLLPPVCPFCAGLGPAPCVECRAGLEPAPVLPPPAGLADCAALLAYRGQGRDLVAGLKYRNARSVVAWLTREMAALAAGSAADVVTWAPTTRARRRQRGFDHGQVLAMGVAQRLGLPCRRLLGRRDGPPQTGRSRAQRLRGPAFTLARAPGPARVLLVDDVVTTGATLSAAARHLRAAGAEEVRAVVAARRP